MVDTSANAVVPGMTREDHGVQVLREIAEMMLLERKVNDAKTNEESYRALRNVVARELPWAMEIPAPAAEGTSEYKQWERDMTMLRKLSQDFVNLPAPAMPTPYVVPLRGGDTAYQYQRSGGGSYGTIEADHTAQVWPTIQKPEAEKAYHKAVMPLFGMYITVKRVYKRYHLWDERTEVALRLSDFSEEQGQRLIDRAYVETTGDGLEVSEESSSEDDGEDDEDLGFMDS